MVNDLSELVVLLRYTASSNLHHSWKTFEESFGAWASAARLTRQGHRQHCVLSSRGTCIRFPLQTWIWIFFRMNCNIHSAKKIEKQRKKLRRNLRKEEYYSASSRFLPTTYILPNVNHIYHLALPCHQTLHQPLLDLLHCLSLITRKMLIAYSAMLVDRLFLLNFLLSLVLP